MKYQNLLFIILFAFTITLFQSNTYAQQNNGEYKRELRKFMKFIRNTEFKRFDTLKIKNYLCNKNLFSGTPLYGTGRNGFSNEEKEFLIKQIQSDTAKYYIRKNLMNNIQFVPENDKNHWELSKPIFLRSNLLCVFSFASPHEPDGGREWTYLYKKEKGKWSLLFKIGGIENY
jgi:hypothetical protein